MREMILVIVLTCGIILGAGYLGYMGRDGYGHEDWAFVLGMISGIVATTIVAVVRRRNKRVTDLSSTAAGPRKSSVRPAAFRFFYLLLVDFYRK